MEVIILPDEEGVAARAAATVGGLVGRRPDAVLGLATGSTPVQLYRQLVRRHRESGLSFAGVTTFNLDEYIGLPPGHAASYRHFMGRALFDHIDISPDRTHFPECEPDSDPRGVGPRYEAQIGERGGIDLQVLGIGRNGHIGFNEPTSSLASRTRVKTLTRRTLEDNRRMFQPGQFQPRLAVTMGIATILDARRILLLATGEHKAEAVRAAVEGPIGAMHPASVLQAHPRVRVLLDEAAASRLELKSYYRWVLTEADAMEQRFGALQLSDPWL